MKLIEITDKNNRIHYINPNQITRVFVQKDDTVTIIMSDGGDINTKITYQDLLKLLS